MIADLDFTNNEKGEQLVGALLNEGPNRSPGVRRSDVAEITSPIRPRDRHEPGIAAAGQLTHPRNALWRFTLVRNHNASMASFRPALTEARQHNQPSASRPVNSGPRPCLLDVGFPLSGPEVRTFISDLIHHARHTRLASGLGSATLTRSHPLTTGTMCWRRSDTVTGRRSPGCELVAPQRLEHHQLIPELPLAGSGEGSRRAD
jgi:hypothetical protein